MSLLELQELKNSITSNTIPAQEGHNGIALPNIDEPRERVKGDPHAKLKLAPWWMKNGYSD